MDVQVKQVSCPERTLVQTLRPQHKRPGRIRKAARAARALRLKDSSISGICRSIAHPPENLSKGAAENVTRQTARKENRALSLKLETKSPENEHLTKFLQIMVLCLKSRLHRPFRSTCCAICG